MKRAERMIRIKIEQMTCDRIAPQKNYIENAIEFMYLQGTFSKRKYEKMKKVLSDKYTEIMNKHDKQVSDAMDRDFELMMERYNQNQNS